MDHRRVPTRRSALALAVGAVGSLLIREAEGQQPPPDHLKGRIKQSVAQWCFGRMALDTLCENAKAMGLVGIDMQIMEGDVCTTIKENIAYIGHFHTGGVPGRHEIDETQELNYTRVCKAIADSGFQGFVAHEIPPSGRADLRRLR
jgi:hypothetical protein